MEALRQLITPTNSRITIAIPEEYANRQLEVIVRPLSQDGASTMNNENKYDFSDLFGKHQWKGDALKEQQKLRDEWK
jgi:hypothetical protein